ADERSTCRQVDTRSADAAARGGATERPHRGAMAEPARADRENLVGVDTEYGRAVRLEPVDPGHGKHVRPVLRVAARAVLPSRPQAVDVAAPHQYAAAHLGYFGREVARVCRHRLVAGVHRL